MSEAFEIVKTGIDFFCSHLVFFNMLFAIVIVFFQRRDPKSVWAWLLLLYFIPVLGFVFYLFLGQDMHKRKMFRIKEMEDYEARVVAENAANEGAPPDDDGDSNDGSPVDEEPDITGIIESEPAVDEPSGEEYTANDAVGSYQEGIAMGATGVEDV